jgi:hypothetical protein
MLGAGNMVAMERFPGIVDLPSTLYHLSVSDGIRACLYSRSTAWEKVELWGLQNGVVLKS